MATVFDDLLVKGIRQGQLPARTQQSREWFRNQARTSNVRGDRGAAQLVRDKSRFANRASLGGMYFFFYDPKTKAKLPYYDRFPLIFKVGQSRGSFEGINMHYLYETANNKRYDESTRLKLSYDVLKAASKYKEFKPTYKKYLTSQVRSRFIEINASEWDIALFLPVERFEKASKNTVWRDSRNAV